MNWNEQQELDKIVPPPTDTVVIGALGTVVMSRTTYELLKEQAELGEIRAGRTGEE